MMKYLRGVKRCLRGTVFERCEKGKGGVHEVREVFERWWWYLRDTGEVREVFERYVQEVKVVVCRCGCVCFERQRGWRWA